MSSVQIFLFSRTTRSQNVATPSNYYYEKKHAKPNLLYARTGLQTRLYSMTFGTL
jgi:hypothetical protein